MIDLVEYIKACAVPYDDCDHNCFAAAAAAFPSSAPVASLRNWWRDQPRHVRGQLSRGEKQLDIDAMAKAFGLPPASAPTGNEIGVIKQLDCAPPIFVVGGNGSWFARGNCRAVRVPARLVTSAWKVV